MFRKTDEVKVLRDPVHGYIHVDYEVVWQCINSAWFQRLRRIRQLGGAYMVYHTADHTRFGHSLGVYEIVRRMVSEVPDISKALNEREKVTAMLAGLMHDIGHGPYSHAFEAVSGTSHEEYTCRIIEEDPEISSILENTAKGLSKDVADVIRHKSENPLLPQLVSSQLDADRMDYLLRDAYFTGTTYGSFDIERILRVLRVSDGRIVIKESGTYAVENYIMSRYHMYWQVYYHPTARVYELMLRDLFTRLKDLEKEGRWPEGAEVLRPAVQRRSLSLDEYFALDENACGYAFACLMKAEDPVARDLAERLMNRRLFQFSENNPANNRRIRAQLKKKGYDLKYYFLKDEVDQRPYVPYSGKANGAIWVRMHTGEILELSAASNIVSSLVKGPAGSDNRVYYPEAD
ncbi:MAG: HD domain-containing protein [Solobacterium sp.]|nr:HD domain-containing protein [Erysipelotrichaceae bacterium]MBQ9152213.1 HD domain-containing protein [Solobacterium sp.]